MSQVFSPRIYSPIQSELFPSEKATPQAFTRGVFLLDLTLSARHCVGVGAGQPVEEALDFKIPTQKTEDLYIASVNHTLDNYRSLLIEVRSHDLHLPNTDFDTGRVTHAGEYVLTDKAYAHLLDELANHHFDQIPPELRQNILAFYSDSNAPLATKRNPAVWKKTQDELQELRAFNIPQNHSPQISTLP